MSNMDFEIAEDTTTIDIYYDPIITTVEFVTPAGTETDSFVFGSVINSDKVQTALEGYTFTGWTWDGQETPTMLGELIAETDSITLTGVFEAWKYTVHFDANGGEGSMDDMTVEFDSRVRLDKNQFTRDGFTFMGWARSSDNTGSGTASEGTASEGAVSEGTASEGAVSEGTASEGAVSEGAASEGAVSEGAASEGAVSEGAASEGAVSEGTASEGTVSEGTASEGAASEGTASEGAASEGTASEGAASEGTASEGATSEGTGTSSGESSGTEVNAEYGDAAYIINLATADGEVVTLYAVWTESEPISYTVEHHVISSNGEEEIITEVFYGLPFENTTAMPLTLEGYECEQGENGYTEEIAVDGSTVITYTYNAVEA